MSISYSVLINTTDSFEDCWEPFFTLFKKYWPDCTGSIYLNTETKIYSHNGLNIISIQNNIQNPEQRITWSECLIRALKCIDTDIILYMQEDYFLKDTVKNNLIIKYLQIIHRNTEIDCIHLTDQALLLDKKSDKYEGLYSVISNQRYLINCQTAIWRKSAMLRFLRSYENAWQFEEFGSIRASNSITNIYGVDKNWVKLNEFEIIPYIFTGIVQGRWYEPVVDLFNNNNIHINYKLRGFVKDAPKRTLKQKLFFRFFRIPILARHTIELFKLKMNKYKLLLLLILIH